MLHRITLGKDADLSAAFAAIQDAYPSVGISNGSFRLCALRLPQVLARHASWGRSSPYMFLTNRSSNFLVLAPNTTIYNKLIDDFTQGSAKVCFQGHCRIYTHPPVIVTGDNWDDGKGVRGSDLFDSPIINIFNVDKINRDQGRIRKMQEYIGEILLRLSCRFA